MHEPEIIEAFGGFQITLFKDQLNEKSLKERGLNQRQITAMLYIKENGQLTNSVYRSLHEVSPSTALRDLEELVNKGFITRTGDKKNSIYRLI